MRSKVSLVGVVLLVAAAMTACGGEEDPAPVEKPSTEPVEQPAAPDEEEASDSGLAPVEFLLPEAAVVPANYQAVRSECEEPPEQEGEYRSVYSFGVPSDWTARSRGAGGSGSLSSTNVDLGFETSEGGIEVAMDHDKLDPDGVVMDWQNEPFTSFDEEITWYSTDDSTERTEVITFEDLGTINLANQEVTLWRAAQEQNPERLSSTRYKARISTVSVPQPNADRSDAVTRSIVVTVEHDSDEIQLDQDVVEQIIGSFAIAPCVRTEVYQDLELMYGEDLDGDGKVRSIDDVLAELEDLQEG